MNKGFVLKRGGAGGTIEQNGRAAPKGRFRMFSIIVKAICLGAGMSVFYALAMLFNKAFDPDGPLWTYNMFGFLFAGLLFGLLVSPYVEKWILNFHKQVLRSMQRVSPHAMASGFAGLMMGFFFAMLLTAPFWYFLKMPAAAGVAVFVLLCVVLGYLGVLIFSRVSLWGGNVVGPMAFRAESALPKVLDTSVLIDGRILELYMAGFLEGKLFVPDMVIAELQGIADDSDSGRRKRGRRGLDVLTKMKEKEGGEVEIVDLPAPRAGEPTAVDARLVNYAKSIGGALVTNDFNLTKVAKLRGVRCINLNVLSNSMRKTLLPGERVEVSVVKTGKEHGQGIAYLDDGTMIVVESGDRFIGDSVMVEISSIMQTVAGRLIFARATEGRDDDGEDEER